MTHTFSSRDIGDKLLIASHNAGKLREFKALLANFHLKIVSALDLELPDVEETADNFRGNALLKAQAGLAASGLPSVSDDSGLCITALGGAPGIHSARWAGPTRDFTIAIRRIEQELEPHMDKSARFTTVLALALPNGQVHYFEGHTDGHISFPMRGPEGLGYDPIFVPEGYTQTYAEMGLEKKNMISPRTKALKKFLAFYQAAAA